MGKKGFDFKQQCAVDGGKNNSFGVIFRTVYI